MSEPAEGLFHFRKAVMNAWELLQPLLFSPTISLNGDHLVSVASLFMKARMQRDELKNGHCYIHVNR